LIKKPFKDIIGDNVICGYSLSSTKIWHCLLYHYKISTSCWI